MEMKEFTWRAVLLGLGMTVVLGAANAYLGLRAGITIAATYPAAVIGMAVLRGWKGTILEENIARTSGTIGEGIAAGAIFTIPAFLIAGVWPTFFSVSAYLKTTALIMVGSILGVLFISLVRKGMVEDPELPFPESVAAGEIHKAGRRGAEAAKYLFWNIGIGGVIYLLGAFGLFAIDKTVQVAVGALGRSQVRLGTTAGANVLAAGGASTLAAPEVSPALLGVGYIIGLRLAALQFSGSVLAWGLMVPLIIFFLGPQLHQYLPVATPDDWVATADAVWRFIVRPIAVGGMLVGSVYTLYRMKDSLVAGLGKAFADLRPSKGPAAGVEPHRTLHEFQDSFPADRRDVPSHVRVVCEGFRTVLAGNSGRGGDAHRRLLLCDHFGQPLRHHRLVQQSGFRYYAFHTADCRAADGFAGRFRSAWSGDSSRCGRGRLRVFIGRRRAIAGFQSRIHSRRHAAQNSDGGVDCRRGRQPGHVFPADALHKGFGFGSAALPAPQAGLMATLATGIVGGNMPWPLVVVGMLFGIAMIMMQVRSPMLVAVGMYLPFATTFAIFVGGVIRSIGDWVAKRRGLNAAQHARVENAGILTASGLIAGEALMGLLWAGLRATVWSPPKQAPQFFTEPLYLAGTMVLLGLAALMILWPLTSAGDPNEPAPPTAMM